MTTVPPCDRGGLPWSRPPGDGLSGHDYLRLFARLGTSWAARLGEQTRRDELHGLSIFVCRDGDGKWLVRAIFMARGLVSPRNFCCFAPSFFGGNKPQRTQAII